MGFSSIPVQNSGLAQALNITDFEFCFAGGAVGANGAFYSLVSGQNQAADVAYLAIGGTTNAAAVDSTVITTLTAKMTTLVTPEGNQAIQYPAQPVTPAEQALQVTGLANHIGQIEAKTTGGTNADDIAWVIKGLPIKQIISVELICKQAATMSNIEIIKQGPAILLPEPVTLGAANKIIKSGTTQIDFDTDYICLLPKSQIAFGALRTATNNTLAPASGDILVLKIKAVV